MLVNDTMSNLRYGSSEASISSSNQKDQENSTNISMNLHQQQESFVSPHNQAASKKKRNLPGNPDPEAEVVALSPRSLVATNRFVCEICKKGFQRDQNLQLHRRGHNLPWKLKQRSKQEVIKKKVYVCPEITCVHHDPSRALGDLTGIKKHFSRKHGEKKWKCEKCSKRYAVQSDWKAHSKICGTREYRCDCGTLFSRRDSFITHRAFCDALAVETSKSLINNIPSNPQTAPYNFHHPLPKQEKDQIMLPPWLSSHEPGAAGPPRAEQSIHQQYPNPSISNNTSLTSATALLQKAAQMGVTMSTRTTNHHMGASGFCATAHTLSSPTTPGTAGMPSREEIGINGIFMHDHNLASTSAFDISNFNGTLNTKGNISGYQENELTRDFLGMRGINNIPHRDFVNIDQMGTSSYHDQGAQNQPQWHG